MFLSMLGDSIPFFRVAVFNLTFLQIDERVLDKVLGKIVDALPEWAVNHCCEVASCRSIQGGRWISVFIGA